MTKIKLVALDLDGTMLEWDKTILPELREALIKLSKKGVKVTTASGRPLPDQVKYLNANKLGACAGVPHALIANEQEIYFLVEKGYRPYLEHYLKIEREWKRLLPSIMKLLEETEKELKERGFNVKIWVSEEIACERHLAGLKFESSEEARWAEKYLNEKIREKGLKLKCSRVWALLQVILSSAGKGETLRELADYWRIDYNEVLCVGDCVHDLDMLDSEYGFIPATVSNAVEEVKEVVLRKGGYVSPFSCGKGVLDILKKYRLIE